MNVAEFAAHFLGNARHLVEALRAADIDPVPELLNAHLAWAGATPMAPSCSAISARDSPTSDGFAGGT